MKRNLLFCFGLLLSACVADFKDNAASSDAASANEAAALDASVGFNREIVRRAIGASVQASTLALRGAKGYFKVQNDAEDDDDLGEFTPSGHFSSFGFLPSEESCALADTLESCPQQRVLNYGGAGSIVADFGGNCRIGADRVSGTIRMDWATNLEIQETTLTFRFGNFSVNARKIAGIQELTIPTNGNASLSYDLTFTSGSGDAEVVERFAGGETWFSNFDGVRVEGRGTYIVASGGVELRVGMGLKSVLYDTACDYPSDGIIEARNLNESQNVLNIAAAEFSTGSCSTGLAKLKGDGQISLTRPSETPVEFSPTCIRELSACVDACGAYDVDCLEICESSYCASDFGESDACDDEFLEARIACEERLEGCLRECYETRPTGSTSGALEENKECGDSCMATFNNCLCNTAGECN